MCEGDDYWTDPLKLQKQIDFLESNPGYVACAGNAREMVDNELKELIYMNEPEAFDITLEDEVVGNRIITLTICYRNVFTKEDLRFFKETPPIDWLMWCVLCKYGKFRIINQEFGVSWGACR